MGGRGRLSEFKANLVSRVSSRIASQNYTEKPVLKNEKGEEEEPRMFISYNTCKTQYKINKLSLF